MAASSLAAILSSDRSHFKTEILFPAEAIFVTCIYIDIFSQSLKSGRH